MSHIPDAAVDAATTAMVEVFVKDPTAFGRAARAAIAAALNHLETGAQARAEIREAIEALARDEDDGDWNRAILAAHDATTSPRVRQAFDILMSRRGGQ